MRKITIEVPESTMNRLEMMAVETDSTVEFIAATAVDVEAAAYFDGKDGDPK